MGEKCISRVPETEKEKTVYLQEGIKPRPFRLFIGLTYPIASHSNLLCINKEERVMKPNFFKCVKLDIVQVTLSLETGELYSKFLGINSLSSFNHSIHLCVVHIFRYKKHYCKTQKEKMVVVPFARNVQYCICDELILIGMKINV